MMVPSFTAIYKTNTEQKENAKVNLKNKKQQQKLGPEMMAHTYNPSKGITEHQTGKEDAKSLRQAWATQQDPAQDKLTQLNSLYHIAWYFRY